MSKVRTNTNSDTNSDNTTPEPATVLQQAHQIIYGDRERTYGKPEKNLQTIADYWSTHLSSVFNEKLTLTIDDVCSMMILLKTARLANDPHHKDSLVDICGYAALSERCKQ